MGLTRTRDQQQSTDDGASCCCLKAICQALGPKHNVSSAMSATCKWNVETRKGRSRIDFVDHEERGREKRRGTLCKGMDQHAWPWKVTNNELKCFYVQIGQIVSTESVRNTIIHSSISMLVS